MKGPDESAGRPLAVSSSTPAQSNGLRERIRGISEIFDLLRPLVRDTERFDLLSAARDGLVAEAELIPDDAGQGDASRSELEALASETEIVLLEFDATVAMRSFRERFTELPTAQSGLIAYARLLACDLAGADDRLDRFEFVVTRLATRTSASGTVEMRAALDIDALAAEIGLAASAPREVAPAAIAFLSGAAERAEAVETPEEIFESGLYSELRDFKRSLGTSLLEPDILFACLRLNVVVTNKLRSSGMESLEIDARAAGADTGDSRGGGATVCSLEAIQQEFEKVRQTLPPRRIERPKGRGPKAAPTSRAQRRRRSDRPGRRQPGITVKLLAAMLAAGLTLFLGSLVRSGGDAGELTELDAADLASISSVLESGTVSAGGVFIGKLKPSRWSTRDRGARDEAAQAIRAALQARDIAHAMIFYRTLLAVQIEKTAVVFVE